MTVALGVLLEEEEGLRDKSSDLRRRRLAKSSVGASRLLGALSVQRC